MLAVIELKGKWTDAAQKMPKEEWEVVAGRLTEVIPGASFHAYEKPEPDAEGNLRHVYNPGAHLVDLTEATPVLAELQIEFDVKRFKGTYRAGTTGNGSVNTNIQIAIPDMALLQIVCVKVLEDACTQDLQRQLDDGWRILAICPPHAQRRPDYILGHHDQKAARW